MLKTLNRALVPVGLALCLQAFAEPAAAAEPSGTAAPSLMEVKPMTFQNGSVTLDGTLYRPRRTGPVPAVIVFHAASNPSRDARLYWHLVEELPKLGVAVLVYDRRGTGKSGGSNEGDFDTLAGDGIAAIRALAIDPGIDARRIGYWGLSQGGWLALLAATKSPAPAFAIAVSAPAVPPDRQMMHATANILRIKGFPKADIEAALQARAARDAFMRGRMDRQSAERIIDAAAANPWFEHIYVGRPLADPDKSSWAREMRHDPGATIRKVAIPTLIIYGTEDPWVPVNDSARSIAALRRPNIQIVTIAGADHSMATRFSPAEQIDPAKFDAFSPDSERYLATLRTWLTRQGLAR